MDEDISIVLCGAAGQGIQTVESLLTKTLKKSGFNVFATREYMSRVRGGVNSTSIRISSKPVRAYVDRIDLLIPLNAAAIPHVKDRITPKTVILGEKEFIETAPDINCIKISIAFQEIAKNSGGKIYTNIVSLGTISAILDADQSVLEEIITKSFKKKGQRIIDENINAANKGIEIAIELIANKTLRRSFRISKDLNMINDYLLDGRDAIALGAIAGGVNYVTFYPMSPSTGVSTFLAQQGFKFSIIVDQSEDEISVINKALGASYAGARSFISTSGGGFSLMCEGLSLAGSAELPLVIHNAQRPAPATGMPTRTSQGDLDLVLYAGAGYFPRIIFAPGTIKEAFELTQKAFNLAQEFQIPVIVLTDQYFVNTYYNISSLDHENLQIKKFFKKTDKNFKRYKLTETGISPFGIPGFGDGLVVVDSHTHTEEGHITEDAIMRNNMVEKRLKKYEAIKKVAFPPELIGEKNYDYLIISWGSNYQIIKEALEKLDRNNISFLHFKQIYPLYSNISQFIDKAKYIAVIENNPVGQFTKLIENELNIKIDIKILKYSGYPFSVEELCDKLKNFMEGNSIV